MSDEKHPKKGKQGHGGGGGGGGHGGGGHGGGGKHHEEESGAPEWLISFADNTALIMGFFVILLAMEMAKPHGGGGGEGNLEGQSTAQLDWAIGVREAFNNPVSLDSTDPGDRLLVARLRQRLGDSPAKGGGSPTTSMTGDESAVRAIDDGTYFTVGGTVLFHQGSAEIAPDDTGALDGLARIVGGRRNRIIVRGHASGHDVPNEANLDYRDLSYHRARAVADYLVRTGNVREEILVLEAMGDSDPAEPRRYSAAGQAPNRRVQIILTETIFDDGDSPPAETGSTGSHGAQAPADGPAPGDHAPAPSPPPAHDDEHEHDAGHGH